jgi:hypothetical protein
MNTETDAEPISPSPDIDAIHQLATDKLTRGAVPLERITNGDIRPQSVLYMVYWFDRLKNNKEEQARVGEHLVEYIGDVVEDPSMLAESLASNIELRASAKTYVEKLLVPAKTVDLVITKHGSEDAADKEILCMERNYYPLGVALPGGFIKDSDEDNDLGVTPEVFAALRVAGEKVLGLEANAIYEQVTDENGKKSFLVHGDSEGPVIRLYPEDAGGYRYRDNIKSILRPSDPRHIVDTIGFRCEIEGEPKENLIWRNKSEIMSPENPAGGFAFAHHREIVAFVTGQSTLEKQQRMQEHELIRNIINNPLESYKNFKERFEKEENDQVTPMPELFPAVNHLLRELFSERINAMCEKDKVLNGYRDLARISLRQVSMPNRILCPYVPTLQAIAEAVTFFDVVARSERGFYIIHIDINTVTINLSQLLLMK